jgi:uncharacterized protein
MKKTKRQNVLILVTVAVCVLAWFIFSHSLSIGGNRKTSVNVGGRIFRSEVVASEEKMQKGLGGRDGLCPDCAMLFKFQQPGIYPFWMKDMRFSLDIIWINQGKIVYLKKNIPADSKDVLTPSVQAESVLEVNAGTADKLGLKVGDSVAEK